MTAPIGKAAIMALIPHAGAMCLLDSVYQWDSLSITCVTSSHRDANNPLASGGRLDSLCGIEYAAQAMAIHGGLTSGRRSEAGYLASVRGVVCTTGRLDQLRGDLEVSGTLLAADTTGAIYDFRLRSGEKTILSGRAAVVMDDSRLSRAAPRI